MNEMERAVNRGIFYIGICRENIERGKKQIAIDLLKTTKSIIDNHLKYAGELNIKYQEVKTLYETKFGKLEKELQ